MASTCVVATVLLSSLWSTVTALSSPSPWAAASWRLRLNVGREAGSAMPDAWGASGARLVLPVDVSVESERWSGPEDAVLRDGALSTLRPTTESRYVNARGQQRVRVREGGWRVSLPAGGAATGRAADLGGWLDVDDDLERNDVALDAGTRLYLTARCWRDAELATGRSHAAPLVARYEAAQRALEERLAHDTGDRRLDGTDPVDTVRAYRDMTELVVRRDDLLRQWRRGEEAGLPPLRDDLPRGRWPGSTEPLSVAPRHLFVRRKKQGLFDFGGDELLLIGTWTIAPIVEE